MSDGYDLEKCEKYQVVVLLQSTVGTLCSVGTLGFPGNPNLVGILAVAVGEGNLRNRNPLLIFSSLSSLANLNLVKHF